MSNAIIGWMLALGALLIVLPGLNLIGAVLIAVSTATVTERVLGKPSPKELG